VGLILLPGAAGLLGARFSPAASLAPVAAAGVIAALVLVFSREPPASRMDAAGAASNAPPADSET